MLSHMKQLASLGIEPTTLGLGVQHLPTKPHETLKSIFLGCVMAIQENFQENFHKFGEDLTLLLKLKVIKMEFINFLKFHKDVFFQKVWNMYTQG